MARYGRETDRDVTRDMDYFYLQMDMCTLMSSDARLAAYDADPGLVAEDAAGWGPPGSGGVPPDSWLAFYRRNRDATAARVAADSAGLTTTELQALRVYAARECARHARIREEVRRDPLRNGAAQKPHQPHSTSSVIEM